MRKFTIGLAKPVADGENPPPRESYMRGAFSTKWLMISFFAIIILAFLIRFVFAYGISAGNSFALSGGSNATEHLYIIESILNGSFSMTDSALNYPIGSTSVYPPLFDFVMAGVASVGTLFGLSASTAAAAALAWTAPIFAALTCVPIYLIGKKMFNDEKIGILSALFYALFALLIMETVFSNGTEMAFIGFLFASMLYFIIRAFGLADNVKSEGFLTILKNKSVLLNVIIAGILLSALVLSWNKFGIIITVLLVLMVIHILTERLRKKEMHMTLGIYALTILIALFIGLPVYLASGLWDLLYSGPFILGVISVGLMVFFVKTSNKPWTLMAPITLLIAGIIFAVLFFVSPELFSDVVNGNSFYEGSLMNSLISSSTTSLSAMAAYFGWLTLWSPVLLFVVMFFKYRKNIDSSIYTFTMWWLLAMFAIGWFSSSYAIIAGAAFAVASAAMVVYVIRYVELKNYFKNFKGSMISGGIRKALKPVPLVTAVLLVGLILAPNVIYAVDAATPTNSEKDDGYFGGLGYSIMTPDSSSVYELWDEYSDKEKTGALVTWLGFSPDVIGKGGFDSVTDTLGGGASAMAQTLLADGSIGATSALAIRLMLVNGIENFKSDINSAGLDYDKISEYFNNPSVAKEEVIGNLDTYPGINVNVTDENAIYLVVSNYIISTLSEPKVNSFYDSVRNTSGESITYIMTNGSMIPMYYRDGSYFPQISYFGDYSIDSLGAANKFFKYNQQSGATEYTDAMYETFLWKSLFGLSHKDVGLSSSTEFLNALALSDGKIKAVPGYGLSNYTLSYWHVQYNSDDEATGASEGWEDMDAYEAIALQNKEGGMINYLSSIVLYEYTPNSGEVISGNVQFTGKDGNENANGIKVAVFEQVGYDSSSVTDYVQRSTTFTDANGNYEVNLSDNVNYRIVFYSGSTSLSGGTVIATYTDVSKISKTLVLDSTNISGNVVVDENDSYVGQVYVTIKGVASGKEYQSDSLDGSFSFNNVIPDVYVATAYKPDGSVITSANITAVVGNNAGAQMSIASGTISVTVKNEHGNSVNEGKVLATNNETGDVSSAYVENGTATLEVFATEAGTGYTLSASGGIAALSAVDVTANSGKSKSATLTISDSMSISVSGSSGGLVSLMAIGYTTSSTTSTVSVPVSGGSTNEVYTAYSVDAAGNVYVGASSGSSITMTKYDGNEVKGILKDKDNKAIVGTLNFIMKSGETIVTTSASDGKFNIILPAGEYTLYAYDKDDSAMIDTIEITGDKDMGDVNMGAGRTITASLLYKTHMSSSSTKGIPMVGMDFTTTIDSVDYVITILTDMSGTSKFYIPVNQDSKIVIRDINTQEYYFEEESRTMSGGTSDSTTSWSLAGSVEDDKTKYVKTVSVSSDYTIKMTLYGDSDTKYEFSGSQTVVPGQYSSTVKGSTGYYFSGNVYVYPGHTGKLAYDGTSVAIVTFNMDEGDDLDITAVKNDDEKTGKYYVDNDDSKIYYMERGFDYYVLAESGSGDSSKIAYANISGVSGSTTVDLSNKTKSVTVTGYVGLVADGILDITYGNVKIPFTIDDGEFSAFIPSDIEMTFTADVSMTLDGFVSDYTVVRQVSAGEIKDEAVINMYAETQSTKPEKEGLEGSSFNFVNGEGTFNLQITNPGLFDATYVISSGYSWTLYQTYTLMVPAESTGNITIVGYYDALHVGADDPGLSVIVNNILGASIGTYVIPGSAISPLTTSDVYIDVSGTEGAFNDATNTYEYKYAITIINDDNYEKYATLSATLKNNDGKWIIVTANQDDLTISPNGGTFPVKGYGSTVIYVKLMCLDSELEDVPDIEINITMDGPVKTNSDKVSISGNTAKATLSPYVFDLESSDMSASGNDVHNEPSTIPTLFWALMVGAILLLLITAWIGMKRGVFARKK